MPSNLISLIAFLILFNCTLCFGQNFVEIDKIVASDRFGGDDHGFSVAISGDYAIVGAYLESEDTSGLNTKLAAGSAYIYKRGAYGQWNQIQKLVPKYRAANALFGFSVDISGNRAIVSAISASNFFLPDETAFIFEMDATGKWREVQNISALDNVAGDFYAHSVSISGDYAVVGAPRESEDTSGINTLTHSGSCYIYKRDINGNWLQVQKIVASDRITNGQFGTSVSISGNQLIVGSPSADNGITIGRGGAAYVFKLDANNIWSQHQKLIPWGTISPFIFGNSVSISGNKIIVADPWEQGFTQGISTINQMGTAYIFEMGSNGLWLGASRILASDSADRDGFGSSVSIDNDIAVVGAANEDDDIYGNNPKNQAGSAYIYKRDSIGNWKQLNKIVASDRDMAAQFGVSVHLSGKDLIVGAPGESKDALSQNYRGSAGAAYLFRECYPVSSSITDTACFSYAAHSNNRVYTSTGIYTDTIKTFYGCDSIITLNLTILSAASQLQSNLIKKTDILCFGENSGEIILNPLGGTPPYNYNWNNGDTIPSLSNLSAGSYSVTITDSLGCSIADSFKIEEPDKLQILLVSYLDVLCHGEANGELNVQGLGGTPPFQYSWSTGEQTQSLNNLTAGTYNLTVTDSNGCSTSGDFVISQPDSLYIKSSEIVEATCGKTNAGVELIVEGGSGNVSIEWSNGQTGEKLQNVPGGKYQVTITDGNGCTTEADFDLGDQSQEKVFFANTFTPNRDGINDTYKLVGNSDCFTNTNFQIFNRWGEKLFETNSPFEEFWTGSVDGHAPKEDVYVFIFISNEYSESGYLKILH